MSSVCQLLLSTAIGWVLGNFMTAQVIALKKTGKGAAHIGRTGNPGMANIMASLGFKSGIAVLGGDILKTAAAMAVCGLLFPFCRRRIYPPGADGKRRTLWIRRRFLGRHGRRPRT